MAIGCQPVEEVLGDEDFIVYVGRKGNVSRHAALQDTLPPWGLEFILALQTHPKLGGVPEEAREQQGRFSGDRALSVDDGVNVARIDADGLGQAGVSDVHRAEKLLVENLSRMDRR